MDFRGKTAARPADFDRRLIKANYSDFNVDNALCLQSRNIDSLILFLCKFHDFILLANFS